MADTSNNGIGTDQNLALQRTMMASVRTDFALMRTGFTIASFGAGVTELVGRNSWPDWNTDLLASAFILIGMAFVQAGLNRSRSDSRAPGVDAHADPFTNWAMKFVPWLLQIALLALLTMILIN